MGTGEGKGQGESSRTRTNSNERKGKAARTRTRTRKPPDGKKSNHGRRTHRISLRGERSFPRVEEGFQENQAIVHGRSQELQQRQERPQGRAQEGRGKVRQGSRLLRS